ncbi:glycoside hydrolase family 2 protein [Shouchella miscanthi]|uniref:Glycoside hydrolase family 2 TIM barrel-domain containing protein n=1 Tax=Shouchella miscanthi TaxID=2598861 RepID=A0ABU6NJH1_9BACI|nr:sugar-binding domain-containing protein [Shouchella miscanthi]MED4128358.1 glycoside hydrolase family 2 TIM barrel-domain containing protein [Shouchella miscanthi]
MKAIVDCPRPKFVRQGWELLNGQWAFGFDDENVGLKQRWFQGDKLNRTIAVPFTYETKQSGIQDEQFHPVVWYERHITIAKENQKKQVLLHFQASDYKTTVWINGCFAGEHEGGYTSFSFDMTPYLVEAQTQQITVRVEDSMSMDQPRGKQRWIGENFGCWYVQTTGIWQSVWVEYVSKQHLNKVDIQPDLDEQAVSFAYDLRGGVTGVEIETIITFKGYEVRRFSLTPEREETLFKVDLASAIHEWRVAVWSPEQPNLYEVAFVVRKDGQEVDRVQSYFGLRKISIKNGRVLLNNRPIYQKLILDQGYWKDSHLTPPSFEALEEDIDAIKALGFNGIRKHQKIEDERFYALCDQKGLLVWAEMPSSYSYSRKAVKAFTEEWLDVVEQLAHYPSIVTWVPFNESWGVGQIFTNTQQQAFTESIYYGTKAIDATRPVIVNDGWEHTVSDIITLHDYEEFADRLVQRYEDQNAVLGNAYPHNNDKYAFAEGYQYKGQPVIISEYGGIAFTTEDGWGYGNQVKSEKDFLARYESITDAIKALPYVSGYCYTQITDVQQEVNGLLDENRKPKLKVEKIKALNDKA